MDIKKARFEFWTALDMVLDENPVSEQDLITLADAGGIDLGDNPKSRLNYLASLGILRKAEPALYGKGKGGTRFFQKDALEILKFVHEQKYHYAFNEIRDILIERRRDLVKQACRELSVEEQVSEPTDSVVEPVLHEINIRCHFDYRFIRGKVLVFKLKNLLHDRAEVERDAETLESCQQELAQDLCGNCGSVINRYIQKKKQKAEEMTENLARDLNLSEKLLKEIKA